MWKPSAEALRLPPLRARGPRPSATALKEPCSPRPQPKRIWDLSHIRACGVRMTSGSEKRLRECILTIRLSDEERAALDASAGAVGLTPSSYARQLIVGGSPPRPVRKPPAERGQLARILGQLGKIGSNVNQLARSHNMGNGADPAEVTAVRVTLDDIRALVLAAMGRTP